MSITSLSNRPKARGKIALTLLAAALAGCSAGPSKLDAKKVQDIDTKSQTLLQDRLVQESAKLADLQQTLREKLESKKQAPMQPLVPVFNPLDAVNVTLQANNTDARHLFKAIADQAGLNLILPNTLTQDPQTLSLSLTSVPASQAFEQILKALDLSGSVREGMLVVQEFEEQVFDLDFLLTMTSADFNAGGDVFGSGSSGENEGSAGGSGSSGMRSSFAISGRNTNDVNPYDQIDQMLTSIVGSMESDSENLLLQPSNNTKQASYMLNRSTGTLYVRARASQLAAVSKLVSHYKGVLGRQVLIEAQILDVELNDQFRYGVNWNILRNKVAASYALNPMQLGDITSAIPGAVNTGRSILIPGTSLGSVDTPSLGLATTGENYNVGLDLLKTFGTVHMLSNPSIRVRNTQPAVVSVGSNMRYISQSSSNTQNGGGGLLATTANVVTANVFDGIMLGVIPFISDDERIHLTINPMQTSVQASSMALVDVGSEQNPLKISLPRVDFKGMTTSLSLQSGDLVIIGGLISESGNKSKDGLPGLADVPVFGEMFGGQSRSTSARELVLVLRVETL